MDVKGGAGHFLDGTDASDWSKLFASAALNVPY